MDIEDKRALAERLEATLHAYRAIIAGMIHVEWKMENYRAAADLLLQMQRAANRSAGPRFLPVGSSRATHVLQPACRAPLKSTP